MGLLLLALLLAQAPSQPTLDLPKPPPRMEIDASETNFACTFVKALRGETCVYEALPHPVPDARSNIKLAADAAARVCAADAGDGVEEKACLRATAEAAQASCSGRGRGLADEEGRLTKSAESCAVALREAIYRTTNRAVEGRSVSPEAQSAPPAPAPRIPAQAPKSNPSQRKTNDPEKI